MEGEKMMTSDWEPRFAERQELGQRGSRGSGSRRVGTG